MEGNSLIKCLKLIGLECTQRALQLWVLDGLGRVTRSPRCLGAPDPSSRALIPCHPSIADAGNVIVPRESHWEAKMGTSLLLGSC